MSKKDEVLKQALDALEQLQGGCTDHDDGTVEAITVWCPEVIDAIKEALAQPEQELSCDDVELAKQIMSDCGVSTNNERLVERITQRLAAHRPAPANQPSVPDGYKLVPIEPTTEMVSAGRNAPCTAAEEDVGEDYIAVYRAMLAAAPGSQAVRQQASVPEAMKTTPIPFPPASKPWVGLTDEERLEASEIDGADEWFWKVCKAIESKLKEKNT